MLGACGADPFDVCCDALELLKTNSGNFCGRRGRFLHENGKHFVEVD